MRYTLLENGIDSLKAAHDDIINWEDVKGGGTHYIKDALFRLNHAIEILFKYLLKSQDECLIFANRDQFMAANAQVLMGRYQNVFEVDENLKTVTLNEARKRLITHCGIVFDNAYLNSISFLNKTRNFAEHYELVLGDAKRKLLIENIKNCYELSIQFFRNHIPDFEAYFEDARFVYSNTNAELDYIDNMYDVWRGR